MDGVRLIESAQNPADLATKLRAIFKPLAPTVQLYVTGRPPVSFAEFAAGYFALHGLKAPPDGDAVRATILDPATSWPWSSAAMWARAA